MKRWLGGLIAVACGAGLWVQLQAKPAEGGPVRTPEARLDGQTTAAVGALRGLGTLLDEYRPVLQSFPANYVKRRPALLDAAVRTKTLGFDLLSSAGLAQAGLDPAGGVAFIFDRRVIQPTGWSAQPLPVAVLDIVDAAKLRATARRMGIDWAPAEAGAPVLVELGDMWWVAQRAGQLFMVPAGAKGPGRATVKRGLSALLAAPTATLHARPDWTAVMGPAGPGAGATGWIGVEQLRAYVAAVAATPLLETGADPRWVKRTKKRIQEEAAQTDRLMAWLQGQFVGIGAWSTAGGTGARLVATDAGVAYLKRLFAPKAKAPRFSALFPAKGWAVGRLSVNLADAYDTIVAQLPGPPTEYLRLRMLGRRISSRFLPLDELKAAFSGHVAAGIDLGGVVFARKRRTRPDWLMALGVVDAKAADRVLDTLHTRMGGQQTTVDGQGMHRFQLGRQAVVVRRHDDLLLIGSSAAAVNAAIARRAGANLSASPHASAIDGEVVAGLIADVGEVIGYFEQKARSSSPKRDDRLVAALLAGHPNATRFKAAPVLAARARIEGGLRVAVEDAGLGYAWVGALVTGMLVGPSADHVREGRTMEARMHLRHLFDSAVSYYAADHADQAGNLLPKQFPDTVGPSPATLCADGARRFEPSPSLWAAPTWQALDFAIEAPHRYQYSFVSAGTGAKSRFTARAVGDLDCDGVRSTFERVGFIDGEGNVNGGAGLFKLRPLE